ncbi:MAG: hypothetical protein ACRDHZ_01150 [Ktedonobacteraceae bacterium]
MILKRFNDAGISAFRDILDLCRSGKSIQTPLNIINADTLTETLANRIEIPDRHFETRLELAETISEAIRRASIHNAMGDLGVWAWLSAAYFDSVCPLGKNSLRKPGEEYRHIPSVNFRHYYRHLIRGPVTIYRLFKDNFESAMIILCQPPSTPGDFVEQLAARQERITRPAVIDTATKLYYDSQTCRPKKGASATERSPGTLRRYLDILDQLSLTWDLYTIDPTDLLNLLPDEFERWKPSTNA